MVKTGRTTPREVTSEPNEINPLLSHGYEVRPAKTGRGLIFAKVGGGALSEIRDSHKSRDALCETYKVPRDLLDSAITQAKDTPPPEPEGDTENPGAMMIMLTKTQAKEFFTDQFGTGHVTYIEQRPINGDDRDDRDDRDINPQILYPASTHDTIPIPDEKSILPDENKYLGLNVSTVSNVVTVSITRTVALKSRQVKQWIARLYYGETGKAPGSDSIKSAILVLEAEAALKPIRTMYNRVAPDVNGGLWWDLCDELGRAIHVTKNGWEINAEPPQIFKRYNHMLPLPEPAEVGNLELLLDYVTFGDAYNMLLSIVTPITYLVPEVPHVLTMTAGPQGVTKSTKDTFNRMIIDPSAIPLLHLPSDTNELAQQLDQNYNPVYDNVSSITIDQSDMLCRAITGMGYSKRQLYTDDESFLRQFMRPIAINGLNIVADKPDLLSRTLIQIQDPLPEERRKTQAEMNRKMREDAPRVIRAMLDTLVKAMTLYDTVKPKQNHRMADYVKWGCAITKALGIDPAHFEAAYAENVQNQNEEAVKASIVAEWLIKFLEGRNHTSIERTPSDLMDDIEQYALSVYGKDLTHTLGWPSNPVRFGREITPIIPNLISQGVIIKPTKKNKKRIYIITRTTPSDDKETAGQKRLETAKADEFTPDKLRAALREGGPKPNGAEEKPEGPKIIPPPKPILEQLKKILETLTELTTTEAVKDDDLYEVYGSEWGLVSKQELDKLLNVLAKDHTIYSPRPGYWRVS